MKHSQSVWFWRLGIGLLLGAVLVNFYFLSRVTVDDAFITWRYGKNLVEQGIWAYNPVLFDRTQAYTNPIYAALSILPPALGWDMVFFFKLVALGTVVATGWALYRHVHNRQLALALFLLFLAVPAVMLHAFSGLETYLFVALLGLLGIALWQQRLWASTICTLLLMLVRPEAWLLLAMVPAYFWIMRGRRFSRDWAASTLVLLLAFGLYALFHWQVFGYVLPNTFYIKAGGAWHPTSAIKYLLFISPLLVAWRTPAAPAALFLFCFYLPLIVSYATSDLQMDFNERFSFHLFGSVTIFSIAVLASLPKEQWQKRLLLWLAMLALFTYRSSLPQYLSNPLNHYPRSYVAHRELGLRAAQIVPSSHAGAVLAFSDAGIAAFNSNRQVFDFLGLGSAAVAHRRPAMPLITAYNPAIVVLRTDAKTGKVALSRGQKQLLQQWAEDKGYKPVCDMYWRPEDVFRIYAAQPHVSLQDMCRHSKERNNRPDSALLQEHLLLPPWIWWKE